ncbi:B-cell receptor CD22 isoform X1 [Pleuronectes platessa]|uniref:B-cell receptor CD22 isoform X1 n=1 Tax=Pleuronectes platessa TaxID=8262 RepID=UPI00232A6CBE|nr:B-cell receptor CD22 isoform X1 [Pleuronectes platessa]XP_053288954.1 B-cell receptor CD22 isoform X1 [Pleuronectes platessa]
MDALNRRLFLVWLCFNVAQTEASSWTINVPSTVKGHPGSCVVIHCSYNYPDNGKKATQFTGIWTDATHHVVYHPVKSNIAPQYRDRTEMLGNIEHKNCSLKIDPLQQSDQGPIVFRIEMEHLDKFSYKDHQVSITMIGKVDVAISLSEDLVEGQLVVAYCSVSPSCPTSLPVFRWSHSGEEHFHSLEFDDDQWKAKAALTFHPTSADHNKYLQCTVHHSGGQQQKTSKLLQVKHAPVNVRVEYKSDVKEGEAVQLTCTSDAHPPASSYEWFSETGAQLHRGNQYTMPNVSRHMGALYCTAINTVGRNNSSPVRLTVLYAPEIKSISSCSSEGKMVKCVCIADSEPPCMVHFVLSERVLPGTKIERHGSVTIGTLQAEFESSEYVHCLANNTVGNGSLVLSLPLTGAMQSLYIAIAIGAGVLLVILLMAVRLVKKCRGTSGETPTPHLSGVRESKEELSECATVQRKDMNYAVVTKPSHFVDDPVYGNVETDWDDAIYANV